MISEGLEAIAIKIKQLADRVGRLERLDRPSGGGTYTLPTATDSVLGGVKVGAGLQINTGVLSTTDLIAAQRSWML